ERLDAESVTEGMGSHAEDELEGAGPGTGAPEPELGRHPEQVPPEGGEVGVKDVSEGHRGQPVEEGDEPPVPADLRDNRTPVAKGRREEAGERVAAAQ